MLRLAFALFALVSLALAQDAIPVYRAARTVDPITIDGRLSEFTWPVLPRVGRFKEIRNPERTGTVPTEAAIAWDDTNLYIAFACYDREPWSTMRERDDRLWEQEVVEVFLDPDADGKNYPELEVSPNNVVVDLLIPGVPGPRTDASVAAAWDIKGLKTAVGKPANGWTVEIAIPWASLEGSGTNRAPKIGERWRVGLYRIERPGGPDKAKALAELQERARDAAGAEKAKLEAEAERLREPLQFLAWSPTKTGSFHDPARFGIVEFVLLP